MPETSATVRSHCPLVAGHSRSFALAATWLGASLETTDLSSQGARRHRGRRWGMHSLRPSCAPRLLSKAAICLFDSSVGARWRCTLRLLPRSGEDIPDAQSTDRGSSGTGSRASESEVAFGLLLLTDAGRRVQVGVFLRQHLVHSTVCVRVGGLLIRSCTE